ncbi:MAG: GxxExxY protein [Alphaproteobacteria bacterium]|nr:GxxExxY protein [Alphaproteobacteria bacterium]
MNTDYSEKEINELTFTVNGCAMAVLNQVGHGYNEKIYENALAIELASNGLEFDQQRHFSVTYKDISIGTFVPDFVVNSILIIEIKTIEKISTNEKGQVLNYLRASGLPIGLILNFKHAKLEWQRVIL